jgi:hypothetical protein
MTHLKHHLKPYKHVHEEHQERENQRRDMPYVGIAAGIVMFIIVIVAVAMYGVWH